MTKLNPAFLQPWFRLSQRTLPVMLYSPRSCLLFQLLGTAKGSAAFCLCALYGASPAHMAPPCTDSKTPLSVQDCFLLLHNEFEIPCFPPPLDLNGLQLL